jgi:hypothetical protein
MASIPRQTLADRKGDFYQQLAAGHLYSPLLGRPLRREEELRLAHIQASDLDIAKSQKLLKILHREKITTALDAARLGPTYVCSTWHLDDQELSILKAAIEQATLTERNPIAKITTSLGSSYSPLLCRGLAREERVHAAYVAIDDLGIKNFPGLLRALKRMKVSTALDAAKLTPKRILAVRYVGRKKLSVLRDAVKAVITGMPRFREKFETAIRVEEGFSPLLGRRLTDGERAVLSDLPAEFVSNDVRAQRVVRKLGAKTAISISRLTPRQFLSLCNAGQKTLKKVTESI